MHKIWHWFRGDNDPKFWQGAAPSGDKRRWRSERAVGGRTSAGARRQGATIAQNFDAVQAASVSSPTVLTPQQTKSVKTVQDRLVLINGYDKRPSKSSMESAATAAAEDEEAQATTSAAATAKSARKQQQKAKPPIPSTSSANQKVSSRRKSRGTVTKAETLAAVTTDDLPDKVSSRNKANGAEFRVEKKAISANEMGSNSKKQQQRPGTLLQRIRQRFTKSGDRRSAMAELDNAVPSAEHRLSVTMTVEVGTCQNGANGAQQQKLQPQQQLGGAAPMAQQRREDYRLGGGWTRSGDALGDDDASQGRCSSFDYFSANASPIERQRATERRESGTTAEQTSPCHSGNKAADMEEELRFATAAEARAYLRREQAKGEEADEEQEGCDADDEITTATTSALCDSLLFQQRPHSAMASMPGQRESVYFTATVMVQSATTPDIARRKPPLQPQKDQQQLRGSGCRGLTRQKSRSQTELAENAGECGASAVGTAGSSHGSVPGSTTFSRRNLRFIIPQVSICDAEGVPKAANKNRNKNNNNDKEEEEEKLEEDGKEKVGSELFNDEDIVNNNNNNNSQKNMANLGVTEAEDDGMLTEQDKQLRKVLSDMDRKQLTLAQRRQSNMDVVHQASGRRTSTTLIPLTSAQIHLIRSLWRQVYLSKGPTVIGSQISHRLFFKEPEMREMFRRCALPQQFANHDSFSKAHCKQISELIDQVVESLDDLEQVGPLLEQVGRCHAHISGGQLSSKLWNSVAETFIDCTLEWGDRRARSETVRKAWALIIAYMVERIKHGHLEERRQISAIRSTIASLERVALASTTVQQPYYEVQQPTTSSSTQLPVPVSSFCHPIRRVSAFATTGNFSDSAATAARAEQHGRAAGGAAVTTVGTMPNYPVDVASSEACSLATYANASPYANRRRHAQPPPPKASAEKGEKKHHHHHHHHRRSSSSSSQQSPMIGSVGTVRRTEGGALAQRTKRTDAARKSTSNAALPLSLGSLRKKMSVSNASSMRKQNAKESADGSRRQWTDI